MQLSVYWVSYILFCWRHPLLSFSPCKVFGWHWLCITTFTQWSLTLVTRHHCSIYTVSLTDGIAVSRFVISVILLGLWIIALSAACCLFILSIKHKSFRSNNLMMVFNFTIFYGILLIKKYWVDSNIWPVAMLQIIWVPTSSSSQTYFFNYRNIINLNSWYYNNQAIFEAEH